MTEETPDADADSGSSTEDCPDKFTADVDTNPATPDGVLEGRGYWCSSPGVQFRLETSRGIIKIKSFCRTGRPKCPLCLSYSNKYYCQDCVITGDFVHSSTKFYERYADKSLRLFSLQKEIHEAKEKIHEQSAENIKKRKLSEEIKQLKIKLKHIKHLIKTKRERRVQEELTLEKLTSSNNKRVLRLPQYVSKVDKIRLCVEKFLTDLRNVKTVFSEHKFQLQQTRTTLVCNLADIFPISEVTPVVADHPDLMLDCLAEAMRTSYIHGRWVSVEQGGELQYRVVAPLLAGSGDYTPVYALIATSKEGSVGVEPQPAFNISAGLTLITQLIKLIAHITAVPLPLKLTYSEFGTIETSEYRFARKVSKLNLSVIQLCLVLGVHPSTIRPRQTVHNVVLLLEHILGQEAAVNPEYPLYLSQDLQESFTEFGYFEPVTSTWNRAEWETEIHREAEELRNLEDEDDGDEEETQEGEQEENFNEWESVGAEDYSDTLSTSPSDRTMERPPSSSSLSFMSSTVSTFIWGITSPKSPRK